MIEAAVGLALPFVPVALLVLVGWWILRRRTRRDTTRRLTSRATNSPPARDAFQSPPSHADASARTERWNGPGEAIEMDGGNISVARALPIDAALVGDVLMRLRRDTRGIDDALDARRARLGRARRRLLPGVLRARLDRVGRPGPRRARLWDPDARRRARRPSSSSPRSRPTPASSRIRPDLPLTPWWEARMPALLDLAHATLDELAEELLWHATPRRASPPATSTCSRLRGRVHRDRRYNRRGPATQRRDDDPGRDVAQRPPGRIGVRPAVTRYPPPGARRALMGGSNAAPSHHARADPLADVRAAVVSASGRRRG